MRWFWIDRFVEFERGKRAVSIKNVSIAEEHLHSQVNSWPAMPHSLIIEGMAQTGGLLVGEVGGFEERVVLAKVGKAEFAFPVFPGDSLRYVAEVQRMQSDGAIVQGTVHVGDRQQATIELMFAHLDDQNFQGVEQFEPSEMLRWMRLLGLYDVGKDEQGQPLQPPQRMLDAERRVLARTA